MSLSPVSVACYKFEDFSEDGNYDEYCLNIADGRGTMWQLYFTVNPLEEQEDGSTHGDDSVRGYIYLFCDQPNDVDRITAKVTLVVRNQSGDVVHKHNIPTTTYHLDAEIDYFDFPEWPKLKEMLVEGKHLIIDAVIQYQNDEQAPFYVPKNPFGQNMLKLLDSEEDKDVFFNIGSEIISAHKLILKANSTVLANYCAGGSSKDSPIHIKDTKPDVFRHLLNFLYGGDVPKESYMVTYGREIIDACDKFDVVGLKIATENALVHNRVINVDDVAEWIHFADAKTCPLLKEYALSYFVACYRDVLKTEAYKSMKQCPRLMEEAMIAVYTTFNGVEDERLGQTRRNFSVDELRYYLGKVGLDVDGSKEMLLFRLDDRNVTF